MIKSAYLGIDVGSISTNLVLIDEHQGIIENFYIRNIGNPVVSVQKGLSIIGSKFEKAYHIAGVCITGSGRVLIGMMVGADGVKNEISAHAKAAVHLCPEVQTIFEIGGQDSKVTIIRDGAVVDFAMNLVCAAGTGSFLDSQAKRLDMRVEDMSEMAMLSDNPTPIAGRCTVFAESDMIHKQQIGYKQSDIVMGLCQAMVRNYLSNVCRGKTLKGPFFFQGGVSANKGIIRAFEEALGHAVIVPEHNLVMGAFGAALMAFDLEINQSAFRGFDIAENDIKTRAFTCNDCANNCEIIEILEADSVIGRTEGRCNKWEGSVEKNPPNNKKKPYMHLRPLPEKTKKPPLQ